MVKNLDKPKVWAGQVTHRPGKPYKLRVPIGLACILKLWTISLIYENPADEDLKRIMRHFPAFNHKPGDYRANQRSYGVALPGEDLKPFMRVLRHAYEASTSGYGPGISSTMKRRLDALEAITVIDMLADLGATASVKA